MSTRNYRYGIIETLKYIKYGEIKQVKSETKTFIGCPPEWNIKISCVELSTSKVIDFKSHNLVLDIQNQRMKCLLKNLNNLFFLINLMLYHILLLTTRGDGVCLSLNEFQRLDRNLRFHRFRI